MSEGERARLSAAQRSERGTARGHRRLRASNSLGRLRREVPNGEPSLVRDAADLIR